MAEQKYVMGLFNDETAAVSAINAMEGLPWRLTRVHSPIPSEPLSAALKLKKSWVGYFTLAGGILGFFSGFLLAAFTAARWGLIVGGKPVVALVPFFIVGFEFTVLFAVLGNVIGMLTQSRLPAWGKQNVHYDERLSGAYYGILASCDPSEQTALIRFFRKNGGEARAYEN
jgi:molybdopterin-containing oxidoreductase family membrane subunit